MDFKEQLKVPTNVEVLDKKQQIKRLHHELGVIYDRTFLTGDWGADYTPADNFFEDKLIDDAEAMPAELNEFLIKFRNTVPSIITPAAQKTRDGQNEYNRKLFLDIVAHVRDILNQSSNKVSTKDQVQMFKCVEDNIGLFRDRPDHVKVDDKTMYLKIHQEVHLGVDTERYRLGLENILAELEVIQGKQGESFLPEK